MDASARIAHAAKFLLQSPPGEVNDCFADCRAIIADDDALEQGILPALEQYNVEQLIVATAPGQSHQVVICKAAQLEDQPDRFVDPRSQQSFVFDHMRAELSSPAPVQLGEAVEPTRAALEKAATAYVDEHYHQGVSAVYAPLGRQPEPDPVVEAPTPSAMQEDEVPDETPAEAEEGAAEVDEDAESAPVASLPAEADAVPPPQPTEALSQRFQIALVGNKYNPSNYWTGRWRALYDVDVDAGKASGDVFVNVHYYEQGNVQLSTSKQVTFDLASASAEPAALAKDVFKRISAAERDFQVAINEAHVDMNERTLKDLRRQLPLTKSKLNWDRITSYRTAKELRRAE